jgi:hypothetical protein
MSIPAHILHVYQKPTVSSAFVQRKQAYNYRHQISANGWYDTASCDVAMSATQAEMALENWVGNPVKVFVDNPTQPIWEGIITTVAYDSGGVLVRRSIDAMMNRAEVVIQYSRNAAGSQTNITNAANLLPSQAIYGIKEGSINAGVIEEASTATGYGNAMRDTLIELNGWPQSSITQGRTVNIHIEMKGYYHTLEWEMHWNTVDIRRFPSVLITNLLADVTNTTLWFDHTDQTGVESNVSFQLREEIRVGMTKWDGLLRVTEAGNASGDYYIVGIEPTDILLGTRRLYYRQANKTIEYTARAADGLRVRNIFGGLLRPWTIQPDRVLRITDVLTGWSGVGDDPRDVYLRSITYDAERQAVRWQGSDNTTGEGVFQVHEWHRRQDNRWSKTKWLTKYI